MSSRIFVKGLPPTFTDADFKKHFSQGGRHITDAKIFPNRRIGYVGYKTPQVAQEAVKYFNKTFIRMSRIAVELARPVDDAKSVKPASQAPTSRRAVADASLTPETSLKRKRPSDSQAEQDPKLKEFIDAYKPRSKKNVWDPASDVPAADQTQVADVAVVVADGDSDDEYEQVPKKAKRTESNALPPTTNQDTDMQEAIAQSNVEAPAEDHPQVSGGPVSDSDWARSRTSRLLGLLDDEEEEDQTTVKAGEAESDISEDIAEHVPVAIQPEVTPTMPTPPVEEGPVDKDIEMVRSTMRLFLRNLTYDIDGESLQEEFEPFGNLEEVSLIYFLSMHARHPTCNAQTYFSDDHPDRDSLCFGM
jgi:multiple RNA-binding domain-containing protein 1